MGQTLKSVVLKFRDYPYNLNQYVGETNALKIFTRVSFILISWRSRENPDNGIRNMSKDVVENPKDFSLSQWPVTRGCPGNDLKERTLLLFKVKNYRRRNLS